ncbi:MAG: glycosyltransferase family 2 protein [Marinicaulis sp.]|nr:glycosyltransferase family 2 protein [Marinicaulis sp.]
MTLSICIFAYNEQHLLPYSIGALDAAAAGAPYHAHILINGCTDDTLLVAKSLASADPRITLHELPISDKANAWNEYVFRIAPDAHAHIFLDGDIIPSVNSIAALDQSLQDNPCAYGAAALPVTGRSQRKWAERLYVNQYLSGNLYALSADALSTFRQHNLRLPFGAKGEDGLITYIFLTNFLGGEDDSHHDRIVVSDGATFEFESLRLNWRDVKIYHRRLQRYSERHFQKSILYSLLKKHGLKAMPDNIGELYTLERITQLRPRPHPLDFIYDWSMLRKLRSKALESQSEPPR